MKLSRNSLCTVPSPRSFLALAPMAGAEPPAQYKLAALHAKQQGDTAASCLPCGQGASGGSGLEVEDRMLLTLCDSKNRGLWSQTDPDLNLVTP